MPGRYGLGVDTGGTFTDAVIVDLDTRSIVSKAKSPTTHHDLSVGLYASVDKVFAGCSVKTSEIASIGVSTTLATNSVLEGKGGRTGLILIGWEPHEPMSFGESSRACIKGGFDCYGKMAEPLDENEATEAIRKVSKDCDAIAISGLYSVMNPSQEVRVKRLAEELTGLPTVMGSELSSLLGIDERARTAVLNGRLVSEVRRFLDGLEATFRGKGLTAPIMVYKGDGSVMSIETARTYPVESVFSGPAASSIGGKSLTGLSDFIMIDIGGTSTDIAIVEDGMPDIRADGADICGWRTHVKAVDMYTMALGGDSAISLKNTEIDLGNGVTIPFFSISRQKSFNFTIGPERVVPLSVFAEEYPEVIGKIGDNMETEFYALISEPDGRATDKERRIADAMRGKGPMGRMEIMQSGTYLWSIDGELKNMRDMGWVKMSSLTPSDLLVYKGLFDNGDPEGSKAGVRVLSELLVMKEDRIVDRLLDMIHAKIAEAIVTKLMDDRMQNWKSRESMNIIKEMTSVKRPKGFAVLPRIDVPIVCIGAPTKHLMGDVGQRLGAELVFPDDADVGNAVGAVSSKMVKTMTAVIEPNDRLKLTTTIPLHGQIEHGSLEEAVRYAREKMSEMLTVALKKEKASGIEVKFRLKVYSASSDGLWNQDDFDHAELQAKAVGDPPTAD